MIRTDPGTGEGYMDFPTVGDVLSEAHRSSPGRLSRAGGAVRSYLGSNVHRTGSRWAKEVYGVGVKGKMRYLGYAFAGYTAYEGYQREGVRGAIKGLAQGAGEGYAMGAVWGAVGTGVKAGLAVGAPVAGMAAFMSWTQGGPSPLQFLARPYVREHMKKHAKLEMGRPVMDQFGTLSTMRQRSLAAIQSSKINGRSGLGNEATLMYRPYFR